MTSIAPYSYRGLYRSSALPSCVLTVSDLRRLFRELDEKTREAAERELAKIATPEAVDAAEFERQKRDVLDRCGVTVTILAAHGRQIVGTSEELLDDANLPDGITQVIYDSELAYKSAMSNTPLDRFRLRLDFAEPPGLNGYNPFDQNTPNRSNLEVVGASETWATAVHEGTLNFLRARKTARSWLHSVITYNVGNWLIGIPAAFWMVFRLDQRYQGPLLALPGVLRGALYVYLVLLGLLAYRVCMALLRWTYPLVELAGARSGRIRVAISAFVGSILTALAYDVLKAMLAG